MLPEKPNHSYAKPLPEIRLLQFAHFLMALCVSIFAGEKDYDAYVVADVV